MSVINKISQKDLQEIKLLKNEPLSHYSNTCTGGPADFLAFPKEIGRASCRERV